MQYIAHWSQHESVKAEVLRVLLQWINLGHLEKHACFTSVNLRLKYLVKRNKTKNPLFSSRLVGNAISFQAVS